MKLTRTTFALLALCAGMALPLHAQQPVKPQPDTGAVRPGTPDTAAGRPARPPAAAITRSPGTPAPASGAVRRADTASAPLPAARRARPGPTPEAAAAAKGARTAASAAAAMALAPDLAELLEKFVRLKPDARDRAERLSYLRTYLGPDGLRDQLSLIAADTAEPATARATALIAIGDEHPTNLGPMAIALDDPDPTVRAAGAIALRTVLADPLRQPTAVVLLRRALRDPVAAVASRALEALGDRDAMALREFLAGNPPANLAGIARELLGLAENGGAPLVPADSSGRLSREAAGVTLEFVPTRRWPSWEMSVGTLTVRRGGSAVELARDVEVVRNVVPAAISADGRLVAFESNGHVRVCDLVSGTERDAGEGIAPRAVPISPGFVFLRQTKVTRERDRDVISYALRYAAYADGAQKEIGTVAAFARQDVAGNASGARWARVMESAGGFMLAGDALGASVELTGIGQQ